MTAHVRDYGRETIRSAHPIEREPVDLTPAERLLVAVVVVIMAVVVMWGPALVELLLGGAR